MELGLWILFEWYEDHHIEVSPRISDKNSVILGIRTLDDDLDPDPAPGFANISGQPGTYGWGPEYTTAVVFGSKAGGAEPSPQGPSLDSIGLKNCSPGRALNLALECFGFHDYWEKKALALFGKKKPLKDLLDAAAEILPYPMAIFDETAKVLALGELAATESSDYKKLVERGEVQIEELLELSKLAEAPSVMSSRMPQLIKNSVSGDDTERIRINIWINQRIVGFILVFDSGGGFRMGDIARVDKLGLLAQKCIEIPSNEYLMKPNLDTIFTNMISEEEYDVVELSKTLGTFSWDRDDKYSIVRIEPMALDKSNLFLVKLCERIKNIFQGYYSFMYDGGITVLVNLSRLPRDEDPIVKLAKFVDPGAMLIGVSYSFTNIMFFARYYRQSCTAVYYGRYLRKPSPVYATSIALEEISQLAKNNDDISVFIHSDVLNLIEYDKANNSDLSRTLFYYLYFGENSTDAANYLGIHRNTLKYRLGKIKELLSLDIDDKNKRLLLLGSYIMFGFSV
jgi:hypothetical protein